MLGRLKGIFLLGAFTTLCAAPTLEQLTASKNKISNDLVSACKDIPADQKKIIYGALDEVNKFYNSAKELSEELVKTSAELTSLKANLAAFRTKSMQQEAPMAPVKAAMAARKDAVKA